MSPLIQGLFDLGIAGASLAVIYLIYRQQAKEAVERERRIVEDHNKFVNSLREEHNAREGRLVAAIEDMANKVDKTARENTQTMQTFVQLLKGSSHDLG